MGGTMRLGAWACVLQEDSLASRAYGGAKEISERHRHRYEFNREYEALLSGAGLRISGSTPDQTYVEIVEIPGHPYFLWLPIPSRVQVEPPGAAPTLLRVY